MSKRSILHAAAFAMAVASTPTTPLHAQVPPLSSSYDGSLLDRSTLTGNWGGTRDALATRGITITPSFIQFYQGPTTGNTAHEFYYGGKADAFLSIDGAKLGLWEGFGVQVKGEYNFGKTPGEVGGLTLPNNTAMYAPYQNKAGGDLTSVFFSQRFGSNATLLAGKINIIDLYSSAQRFNGGRGIERFQHMAFAAPPSGTLPVALFGAIGSYKMDPLTFSLWVYDPRETLNRSGLEDPFSEGVTVRGIVDLSSAPFGLARKDSFTTAISSEKGTDYTTLPDLGKFINTPDLRKSLISALSGISACETDLTA
jgi:porin